MFIGLTGGMGCGKTAALNFFSESQYITLDADTICHSLYCDTNSEIFYQIYERWGNKILSANKKINRDAVGKLIFSNKKEREWLNALLHPAVIKHALQIYRNSGNLNTIFDVPLLYEVGWEKYFDSIIAVWCSNEIRLQRLTERGMTEKEIDRRDNAQLHPDIKMERADYALINNGTLEQLQKQCKIVIDKINNLNYK